ncbi:hypothetical protein ABZ260_33895, partial [Streptosporangium sp. NPDC006013]|uniref:hypothetical protein n=1 Tax=Streptosporangium sp. NPDC006013 TaxID=3155596 RepID=UPI0033AE29CD
MRLAETGRRPRYCSATCRQAAYRARRREAGLADRLAGVRDELAGDADRIADAVDARPVQGESRGPEHAWGQRGVALGQAGA